MHTGSRLEAGESDAADFLRGAGAPSCSEALLTVAATSGFRNVNQKPSKVGAVQPNLLKLRGVDVVSLANVAMHSNEHQVIKG